jgi:transcriptional regulator with XRE-family HTH domain
MSTDIDYPVGSMTEIDDQEIAGISLEMGVFALVRKRFHELEKSEGLTQSALAERMGLTRAQVSRWFAQPNTMTLRAAGRLLAAMGRGLRLRVYDPREPLSAEEISERARRDAMYTSEIVEVEGHLVRIPVRVENLSGTAE